MKLVIALSAALTLTATAALAHDVIHSDHGTHTHGAECGHQAIEHQGHVDYLHDGHMHHGHDGHVHDHTFGVSSTNPTDEALVTKAEDGSHRHGGDDAMHMVVQHGDHFDRVHNGRLHFVHDDHVDDHGPVKLIG